MNIRNVYDALCTATYSDQAIAYLERNHTLIFMVAILVLDGVETIHSAVEMLEEIAQYETAKGAA